MMVTFLLISILTHVYLFNYIQNIKHKTKTAYLYMFLTFLVGLLCVSFLFMKMTDDFITYSVVFEYVGQFAFQLAPVTILLICIAYGDEKVKLSKFLPLYIVPIITLILIWTTHYHGLYFKSYSINFSNIEQGAIYLPTTYYLYGCLLVSFIILFVKCYKYKLLSPKQLFGIVAFALPLIANVMGVHKLVSCMPVYVPPILFTITSLAFTFITLKPKFLNITPFATEYAIENMSEAFMILNQNGDILKTNTTFNKLIGCHFNLKEGVNLYQALAYNNSHLIKKFSDLQHKILEDTKLEEIKTHFYFKTKVKKMEYELEVHKLRYNNDVHIANIFLFKDMTTHREHFETIKKQRMLMYSQDQLSTIGELASSFALDIDNPLSVIQDGLTSLKQENIFSKEEQDLLNQMTICSTRIAEISKNVTTSFGSGSNTDRSRFNILDSISEIESIVASELKKYNCTLKTNTIKTPIYLYGNKIKFNQVLTNIIVNAIQAYDKKTGGIVTVSVRKKDSDAIIEITDNAGGIDTKIAPHIFKTIFTTKGTLGTGLGLHFSHTLIKGEFNGDISFNSKNGSTTFTITVPYKKD